MKRDRHPKEMFFLALTEACQRFAFWGIGLLLVLYLVKSHEFSDKSATHVFGLFTASAFFLPLFGGIVADRWNHITPVILGACLTAVGCFILASNISLLIYPALAAIACGNALFTPSIYTLLGHAYHNHHNLRPIGFSLYYAIYNAGVFIAMVVLGYLQTFSWEAVFIVCGCVQFLGLIPFWRTIPTFKKMHIDEKKKAKRIKKKAPLHKYEIQRLIVIVVLCLASIVFWAAYNQDGTSLPLLILRHTDRMIGSFEIPTPWFLSSMPLFLLLFVYPLASFYLFLGRVRSTPNPIVKTIFSFVIMGLAFLLLMRVTKSIPAQAISPWYIVSTFALISIAELLIAPIGLSLITHLSPRKYTACLIGFWYCCLGVGSYLSGYVAGFIETVPFSQFFGGFAYVCLAVALVLAVFLKKLTKMRHFSKL